MHKSLNLGLGLFSVLVCTYSNIGLARAFRIRVPEIKGSDSTQVLAKMPVSQHRKQITSKHHHHRKKVNHQHQSHHYHKKATAKPKARTQWDDMIDFTGQCGVWKYVIPPPKDSNKSICIELFPRISPQCYLPTMFPYFMHDSGTVHKSWLCEGSTEKGAKASSKDKEAQVHRRPHYDPSKEDPRIVDVVKQAETSQRKGHCGNVVSSGKLSKKKKDYGGKSAGCFQMACRFNNISDWVKTSHNALIEQELGFRSGNSDCNGQFLNRYKNFCTKHLQLCESSQEKWAMGKYAQGFADKLQSQYHLDFATMPLPFKQFWLSRAVNSGVHEAFDSQFKDALHGRDPAQLSPKEIVLSFQKEIHAHPEKYMTKMRTPKKLGRIDKEVCLSYGIGCRREWLRKGK